MTNTTKEMIKAAILADATVDNGLKTTLLTNVNQLDKLLLGEVPSKSATNPQLNRLCSRSEVAKLIGKTPQRVDQLAKAGLLKKVYGIGKKRAMGFTLESVQGLISGERCA